MIFSQFHSGITPSVQIIFHFFSRSTVTLFRENLLLSPAKDVFSEFEMNEWMNLESYR